MKRKILYINGINPNIVLYRKYTQFVSAIESISKISGTIFLHDASCPAVFRHISILGFSNRSRLENHSTSSIYYMLFNPVIPDFTYCNKRML